MSNDRFNRLIELARRGRNNELNSPPLGFTTRVAAIWAQGAGPNSLLIWERLARWAAAGALVVCLVAAGLGKHPPRHDAFAEFVGVESEAESPW